MELLVICCWLLGGLIGYTIASNRGLSPITGFLGGILLGPILAPLLFLVTPDRKRCSKCREWVQKDALVCPHCREELESTGQFRN